MHRAPVIDGMIMATAQDADARRAQGVLRPGTRLNCSVKTSDPNNHAIDVTWEVRPDVANNRGNGGDFEPSAVSITGAIEQQDGPCATLRVPQTSGVYRVFVYVHNQYRAAAIANLPIEVR